MSAEPISLSARRGRPSHEDLGTLRRRNDLLRTEVRSLRVERAEDVEMIRPHLRRLELVAFEFGPAAMSSVTAIADRLDRMERRDRSVIPFAHEPRGAA